jgi:hypothetical protein
VIDIGNPSALRRAVEVSNLIALRDATVSKQAAEKVGQGIDEDLGMWLMETCAARSIPRELFSR